MEDVDYMCYSFLTPGDGRGLCHKNIGLCLHGLCIALLIYIGISVIDINLSTFYNLLLYYLLIFILYGIFFVIKGNEYAIIFISVVVIGIFGTCIIETFPPNAPEKDEIYEAGVIFEDEMSFLQDGKAFAFTASPLRRIREIDLDDRYERTVFYFGLIHFVAGQERVWGRLFNTLVRGLTSLIIYDLLLVVFGSSLRRLSFWYCILSPVLFVWSFNYLKEIPLVFGIAAVTNFSARLVRGYINVSSIFLGICGIIIVGWFRLYNLIPLLLIAMTSLFIIAKGNGMAKYVFIALLSTTMAVVISNKDEIFNVIAGEGVKYYMEGLSLNESQIEGLGNPIPFMGIIREQEGVTRLAGVSFLLALSPVITSVWALTPLGPAGWAGASIALYAINWWLLMPFIGKGIFDSFRERDYWLMGLGIAFISWFVLSASLRFGVGFDCFRYREALLPIMLVIAGKGYLSTKNDWRIKGAYWPYLFKSYIAAVGLLIIYRGIMFVYR